jgi:hypothetical protein
LHLLADTVSTTPMCLDTLLARSPRLRTLSMLDCARPLTYRNDNSPLQLQSILVDKTPAANDDMLLRLVHDCATSLAQLEVRDSTTVTPMLLTSLVTTCHLTRLTMLAIRGQCIKFVPRSIDAAVLEFMHRQLHGRLRVLELPAAAIVPGAMDVARARCGGRLSWDADE